MLAIAIFIAGVLCLLGWYFVHRRGKASLTWPTTTGTILESQVTRTSVGENGDKDDAFVVYAYQVGGAQFQSKSVSLLTTRNAYKIVQKYPKGSQVQVYYNPQKPSSALLEPGEGGAKIPLVVGIVFVIVAIAMMVVSPSKTPAAASVTYASAVAMYGQNNYPSAKAAFENLAQSGDALSKVYLGVMYTKGQGVPQDLVEGQKWFILAGEPGKANREEMQKGLTPAQEQEAESKAQSWKP